ncbi:F/Y-rich N-terminus-domain-containing protein [Syncephalastrum racemosum]|uniref:F/Y-rich N-terminus-domain-containing protein n=1 Tax=Syncephalastrum racemosum TaxID=13706 RepID=A0A1X2HC08_SYNRA|nr:F/Y-rich N-terminus-domain-containing protein [Syncephalastrum racemosum]
MPATRRTSKSPSIRGVDTATQTEDETVTIPLETFRRIKLSLIRLKAEHSYAVTLAEKYGSRTSKGQSTRRRASGSEQQQQQKQPQPKRSVQRTTSDITMADGDEDELMDEHTEENNENEEVDQLADEDDTIAMDDLDHLKPPVSKRRATRRNPKEVPRDADGKVLLPFEFSSMKLISLGEVEYERPAYHNDRYVWPIGFTIERTYFSMLNPDSYTTYTCRVEDGGQSPLFTLQAADAPDEIIESRTPSGAWVVVTKRANAVRGKKAANAISGPEYYGFSNSLIMGLIKELDNVDKCQNFRG